MTDLESYMRDRKERRTAPAPILLLQSLPLRKRGANRIIGRECALSRPSRAFFLEPTGLRVLMQSWPEPPRIRGARYPKRQPNPFWIGAI
jgi:hypothetical protein